MYRPMLDTVANSAKGMFQFSQKHLIVGALNFVVVNSLGRISQHRSFVVEQFDGEAQLYDRSRLGLPQDLRGL